VSGGAGDPLFDRVGVAAADLSALLALTDGSDITELEITVGATRLSLRRPPIVSRATAAEAADAQARIDGTGPLAHDVPLAIASPLVGIFRASVAPGDVVQPGQSIGRIEALGMPTSVDAPRSGTVEELLVQDGSPVEYGQPLLTLRRAQHAP
jgi:acetyl-CoA carboxylase biotin carboxyl carrier protein